MSSLFSLSASAANVLAFDGNNDLVRDSSFSAGSFAKTSFSVELWLKSDAVNRGYLVQSANSSSAYAGEKIQYSMRLEAGGSVIASYGGKGSYVSAASPSSYGNWHHAAMTLASSGVFTLYIDGKARVTKEGRVSRVSIDPRGVVTIRETAGYEFRVLADYTVTPNAVFAKEGRPIVFINAGDLNADSEDDYYSYYPNGDRQTLYVFPQ